MTCGALFCPPVLSTGRSQRSGGSAGEKGGFDETRLRVNESAFLVGLGWLAGAICKHTSCYVQRHVLTLRKTYSEEGFCTTATVSGLDKTMINRDQSMMLNKSIIKF